LHTHTTFSFGDGYGTVEQHIQRVADLGMTAVALTEHGNTSSHVQLEKQATKRGIKPLFGLEAYVARPGQKLKCHQTIIAENEEGYRNLCRIVTESWKTIGKTSKSRFPTVHWPVFAQHSAGLVVMSGCADSLLSCTLLGGKSFGDKRLTYSDIDFERARQVIERYQDLFGDNYFLEVQRFPQLPRTRVLNPAFAELSKVTGARLVGTADVHYPYGTDNKMQTILHAADRHSTVAQAEAGWEYDILLTYPESDKEIHRDLVRSGLTGKQAKDAILTSSEIGKKCTVELPKNKPIRFPLNGTGFKNARELLDKKLREGWAFRLKSNKSMQDPKRRKEYRDRVRLEVDRITDKDFIDYFLVTADIVTYAKDRKIPVGPARGSAASSLVCYLLRITEIDPLQHPLMLFERFIDPTREELPDIDLDFADDRRHEIFEYAEKKYGLDRVAHIGNFVSYRGKNSLEDVARVYRIPKWEIETVKDLLIERSVGDSRINESLVDTLDAFPKAKEVVRRYPKLRYAIRLEGNRKSLGMHAAGLVISNDPIEDTCPIYTRDKDGTLVRVLAYDKKDAEYVGMLKVDILGLKTMGMIGIALDEIGMDLEDLYRIPLDEQKVLDAFRLGDVQGIFQFEGRATRLVCDEVRPTEFQHLADINALSRPGPLFSGIKSRYVAVRNGKEDLEKLHPIVDALTGYTYGQIVYQEQVLQTIRELGGFPMTRVHDIRKIISQKLGEAQFEAMYEEFEAGAVQRGCTPELALKIWRFMSTSATYSFNIAHSVSYAMLAFWQMWIKQFHPTAFYAAQLAKIGEGKEVLDKRGRLLRDAISGHEELGRTPQLILPPDITSSKATWACDRKQDNAVRAGFKQVTGIGEKTAKSIVDWRDDNKGKVTWSDMAKSPSDGGVAGIGAVTVEKIIDFVSSDDPFELQWRQQLFDKLRNEIIVPRNHFGIPVPTHDSRTIPKEDEANDNIVWMGVVRKKIYRDYIEDARARFGYTEEEIIRGIPGKLKPMKDPKLRQSVTLQCFDEFGDDVYIRFNRWRFPEFKEAIEDITLNSDVIVVRGESLKDFGTSLHVKKLYVLDMSEDETEDNELEGISA
jgi:DNA polymerase-3 subunit alpha